MSQKERRAAIAEERRKLAPEEKEKKRAKRVKAVPMIGTLKSSPNELGECLSYEFIPAMPVCQMNPQKHRNKCIRLGIQSVEKAVNTLVARPVGKKEIGANLKAQQALDVEWEKLVKKKAWQYETVSEWKVIADRAKKTGKKVHVGKVFEICVEKGSELPEGDKLRKFKGRTVFQGNNVKDESSGAVLRTRAISFHYGSWQSRRCLWSPARIHHSAEWWSASLHPSTLERRGDVGGTATRSMA